MRRNTKLLNGNYHALPGTADSWREALSTCFILANKRQKTDSITRAQLPKQPTNGSLFMQKDLAADPVHDLYNLISSSISPGSVVSVAIVNQI